MSVPKVPTDTELEEEATHQVPLRRNETLAVPALVDEPATEQRPRIKRQLTMLSNTVAAPAVDEFEIDMDDEAGVPQVLKTDRFSQPLSVTSSRPGWVYAAGVGVAAVVAAFAVLV
jgi:hypothetical protein